MLYLTDAIKEYGVKNNKEFATSNTPKSNNSIPFATFFHMLQNALNSELSLTSSCVPFIVSRYAMGYSVNQTAKLVTKL